ncbi:MAG: hypothetical protein Sapg2KO_45010 [Saprospiraceae bacterium]
MNKLIGVLMICLLSTSLVRAQQVDNQNFRERLESMKVGFITDKVGLSPKQSQVFWPIYNEYEAAQKSVKKQYRPNKKIEQMSDEELEQRILNSFQQEEELLALKRTYFTKMKTVLNIRQIALLRSAEQEFNKEVLRKMMNFQQRRQRRLDGNGD